MLDGDSKRKARRLYGAFIFLFGAAWLTYSIAKMDLIKSEHFGPFMASGAIFIAGIVLVLVNLKRS